MLIIGISGKIGVGKTTVANKLKMSGAVDAVRDFGDEVKRECSQIFNYPMPWNYSSEGKDKIIMHPDLPNGYMTVREILQWWGTDVRRAQDRWYWVKSWHRWLLANDPHTVVVADVRFVEEAQRLRSMGAWLFRIQPYPEWRPGPNAHHETETNLDFWEDWDRVFTPNFGELVDVALEIRKAVEGK